jgi:hypothetical protein
MRTIGCLGLLLGLVVAACDRTSLGDEYEQWLLSEAVAATTSHLHTLAEADNIDQSAPEHRRILDAARSFRDPWLMELGPCTANLRFSYLFDGSTRHGAADLVHDRSGGEWRVEKLFLLSEF